MPGELDMNKLREEAARRAREMQARAHIPPSRRPSKEPPKEPPKEERPGAQRPPEPPPVPTPPPEAPGLLDAFFKDKERTIILALVLLLSGEGENHELLFALLFLLL